MGKTTFNKLVIHFEIDEYERDLLVQDIITIVRSRSNNMRVLSCREIH